MNSVLDDVASLAAKTTSEDVPAVAGEIVAEPVKKRRKYPPLKDFEDHAITEAVVELVDFLDPSGNPPRRIAQTTGQSYAATWATMTDGEADVHPAWVAIISTVVLGAVLGVKVWKHKGTEEPQQQEGLGLAGSLAQ